MIVVPSNAAPDPFANSVSLLLKSTASTVYAAEGVSITLNGTVAASTTQSKYGGSSIYFPGNQSSYISIPTGSITNFGTGDFTIEAWVYLLTNTQSTPLLRSEITNDIELFIAPNLTYTNRVSNIINGASMTVPTNSWNHFALCRASGTTRAFLNGALVTSISDSSNFTSVAGNIERVGGTSFSSAQYFNGYMDDFRITKAARYTAAFTPPLEAF